MKRIYVDFNTIQTDERERVFVNTGTQPELIEQLAEGMRVIFYEECLEAEGVLEYDSMQKLWFGAIDWSTRKDL
jgi:hypothetical protein